MTHVQYVRKGETFLLQASGHAGAAPRGEDLVCCAVSTLVQTLAQRVLDLCNQELAKDSQVDLRPEGTCIMAKAKHGCIMLLSSYETVVTGLQMLAAQWPQYVTVTVQEIIPGTG